MEVLLVIPTGLKDARIKVISTETLRENSLKKLVVLPVRNHLNIDFLLHRSRR